jgi:hypothetical protein
MVCFMPNRTDVLNSINDRLLHFIDGVYDGEGKSASAYYYVDAINGKILWSYIGEDVYPELTN